MLSLYSVGKGYLDRVAVQDIVTYEKAMLSEAKLAISKVLENIRINKDMTPDDMQKISAFLEKFTNDFLNSK